MIYYSFKHVVFDALPRLRCVLLLTLCHICSDKCLICEEKLFGVYNLNYFTVLDQVNWLDMNPMMTEIMDASNAL